MNTTVEKLKYLTPQVSVIRIGDVLLTSIGAADVGDGDSYSWEIFFR